MSKKTSKTPKTQAGADRSTPSASGSEPPVDPSLSAERAATQETIDGFCRWFDGAFGAGRYPGSLTVDLTDLLDTLRQVDARLSRMLAATSVKRSGASNELFHLRIGITDDLPMIFEDVKRSIDALIGPFDEDD